MKQILREIVSDAHYIPWVIFIFFTTIYFASTVGVMNSGDGTQYALTKSLVEKHSVIIDSYMKWTYFTDYAVSKTHYYSDRELGQSLFGIPFYMFGKQLVLMVHDPYNGEHSGVNTDSKIQVFTVLSTAVIGSLALVLFYLISYQLTFSQTASLLSTGTLGLGTLLWKYSAGYYRQPIICCLFLGIVYALLFIQKKASHTLSLAVLCGLLLGMVVLTDTSMIVAVGIFMLYFLFIIKDFHELHSRTVVLFFIGLSLPLLVSVGYNFLAFNKLIISPHTFEGNKEFSWMKTLPGVFQTPLFPSFFINLFSFSPIPRRVFLPIFSSPAVLYKGIFVQSPILLVATVGLFLLRFKKKYLSILLVCVAMSIIMLLSTFTQFYSPTSFDTRYFLPSVPFLFLGLGIWWKYIFSIKSRIIKAILLVITILLTGVSVLNGWLSNVTNFGPNVTGDHRFLLTYLQRPFFSSAAFVHNMHALFINTFPNVWNSSLLFFIYFPLFFVLYFVIRYRCFIMNYEAIHYIKNSMKSNFTFKVLLFSFIFFLQPLVLFTYHLESNPPGFFIDEAIHGFEAYSLLTTHGHSSNGEFLPRLFLNPGEKVRNHGIYPYFVVPFIRFFGLNEGAVRLTSVTMSIVTLWLLYFLLRERVSQLTIFFIGICWSCTAWVFLLSRIGMEFMGAAMFFTFMLYLIIKIEQTKIITYKLAALFGLTLFLLFSIYAAGKVLAVGGMVLGLLLLIIRKAGWRKVGIVGLFCLCTFGLSLPYVRDGSFFYRSDELKTGCHMSVLQCFGQNMLSHFSYTSYFGSTYRPPDFGVYTHSITGAPLLPRVLLPFLLIGIVLVIRKVLHKDFFASLLTIAAFLAMIPASLTIRGFDSYRSVALLPILFILIAFGFELLIRTLQKAATRVGVQYLLIFVIIITFALLYNGIPVLLVYEQRTQAAGYSGWQYGTRQIVNYFMTQPGYESYQVTPSIAYLPYLYFRFYNPDDRISTMGVSWQSPEIGKHILYAVRPYEVNKQNFLIKKVIYYPNGQDAAFYIGEYK